jgi:glycosyltransferase involved in cell wall biosynthesis
MRILVVTSTFPRWQEDTGPAFVFELCRRLQKRGIKVDVIAPHAPQVRTEEVMDNITVYRYRYCLEDLEVLAYEGGVLTNIRSHWYGFALVPLFLLMQMISVRKILNLENYDLVHAHWIIPQGIVCVLVNMLMPRAKRKPLICTAHGSDLYALRGAFFNTLRSWTIKRLSRLCVVSRPMLAVCASNMSGAEHVSVIPMGVDLKHSFIPLPGIKRKNTRLLFAGRLVKQKGVISLLDALALVRKVMPDTELLLIGDGPLLHEIKERIRDLDLEQNVILTGGVKNSDLPELYATATITVMPSTDQEGFGLVIVEAMGCGCAVVASDLPAIHDIVQHGRNGLLARPGDSVDLADKIMRLLKDRELRERLATNGREDVCKRFDWDETAAQYHKLFAELAVQKGGGRET